MQVECRIIVDYKCWPVTYYKPQYFDARESKWKVIFTAGKEFTSKSRCRNFIINYEFNMKKRLLKKSGKEKIQVVDTFSINLNIEELSNEFWKTYLYIADKSKGVNK